MKIQIQPNKWSCLPTSFAIVLDKPVDEIIKIVGHDGSEIIFPDFGEPFCRKSFHIQELIEVCLFYDYSVTPINANPVSCVDNEHQHTIACNLNFYLDKFIGVLTGLTLTGKVHAVAWDGKEILDPCGKKYGRSCFRVDTFFIIAKINITEKNFLRGIDKGA